MAKWPLWRYSIGWYVSIIPSTCTALLLTSLWFKLKDTTDQLLDYSHDVLNRRRVVSCSMQRRSPKENLKSPHLLSQRKVLKKRKARRRSRIWQSTRLVVRVPCCRRLLNHLSTSPHQGIEALNEKLLTMFQLLYRNLIPLLTMFPL